MSQVSDELLVAYLDGQLDTPQARSVERMVGASDELRARMERLQRSQAYLIQTFETLARRARASTKTAGHAGSDTQQAPRPQTSAGRRDDETPAGATAGPKARRSGSAGRLSWTLAVSLLAAVIGYGAAQWLRMSDGAGVQKIDARVPAPAGRWAQDVARLHAHFVPSSVAPDPESQANRDVVQLQMSRLFNASLPVPDFSNHDLVFRRGQVLSYRGSRMMQLSYTSADDRLVGLYVMSGGPSAQATSMVQGELSTVNWSRDGVRYVIAGDMAETSLRALAAVAMAQIAGR